MFKIWYETSLLTKTCTFNKKEVELSVSSQDHVPFTLALLGSPPVSIVHLDTKSEQTSSSVNNIFFCDLHVYPSFRSALMKRCIKVMWMSVKVETNEWVHEMAQCSRKFRSKMLKIANGTRNQTSESSKRKIPSQYSNLVPIQESKLMIFDIRVVIFTWSLSVLREPYCSQKILKSPCFPITSKIIFSIYHWILVLYWYHFVGFFIIPICTVIPASSRKLIVYIKRMS